ncbi:MAG: hypothetical protein GY937_14095 [bacterium]|nr:hypothetical protein [bacterium]
MRCVHLEGSPTAMGETFGEGFRAEIHELARLRMTNALTQARVYGGREAGEGDLLKLAAVCLEASAAYHPEGHAELLGIARGASLRPETIMALGGLTDLRDALAWGGPLEAFGGCTGFLVPASQMQAGGLRFGQTWDLGTDNQPFVVAVHRQPDTGPATWCVTTVGCLSLMGINEYGLAVGTTNLRTRDARAGVPYLNLIHRALDSADVAEAIQGIETAKRAGAHSYFVADARGHAAVVECTATRSEVRCLGATSQVQTNHCQAAAHAALEGDTPRASSEARLARMQALLAEAGPLDDARLRGFLGDREGGTLAINRDDFDGISTNAAMLAAPAEARLEICQGAPDQGGWLPFGPSARRDQPPPMGPA